MEKSFYVLSGYKNRTSFSSGPLKRLFEMVLIKRECYINDLWELVGYETVSTRHDQRNILQRAIEWLLKRMLSLNMVAFSERLGMQIIPDSFQIIRMPNVIVGILKNCSDKPTILVYGNLDVEEAKLEEGWVTDPFVMCELGNYLYGRGVALDKGPLLCWLNAIQAYRDAGLRVPINVVFIIESMAHCGSLGLETVLQQRISFFRDVSCVVIASRRWQNNLTPCIVYGSRGLVYYHLEVECTCRSLSSCEHSGTLFEALPDLFYLLSSLVDCQMHILFNDSVEAFQLEKKLFRIAEFSLDDYGKSLDVHDLSHQTEKQVALADNCAIPHISIHGIDGANDDGNVYFIIPNKVTGKFSISLAPNQNAEQITKILQEHLGHIWILRESPNKMKLYEKLVIPPWNGHYDSPEYYAAYRAMTNTYQLTPNFIRDGGFMLAPSLFQEHLKKNVLVLPIAKSDGGGCPINERISVENYIMGSQLMTAFMWEYAERIIELKGK